MWNDNREANITNNHLTIHPIAWNNIYKQKCEDGLGIKKKKEDFNTVFLAKQGWTVLMQLDKIWVQLVKAKYLKQ